MKAESKDEVLKNIGGLAQLARAPALHAGGQRFESVILHRFKLKQIPNISLLRASSRYISREDVLHVSKKVRINEGIKFFDKLIRVSN